MADKVEALIGRLAPEPICDDCIVERLGLAALHQASQRTHELAGMRGYERRQDDCAICGTAKMVIRRKGRSHISGSDSGSLVADSS